MPRRRVREQGRFEVRHGTRRPVGAGSLILAGIRDGVHVTGTRFFQLNRSPRCSLLAAPCEKSL